MSLHDDLLGQNKSRLPLIACGVLFVTSLSVVQHLQSVRAIRTMVGERMQTPVQVSVDPWLAVVHVEVLDARGLDLERLGQAAENDIRDSRLLYIDLYALVRPYRVEVRPAEKKAAGNAGI